MGRRIVVMSNCQTGGLYAALGAMQEELCGALVDAARPLLLQVEKTLCEGAGAAGEPQRLTFTSADGTTIHSTKENR